MPAGVTREIVGSFAIVFAASLLVAGLSLLAAARLEARISDPDFL